MPGSDKVAHFVAYAILTVLGGLYLMARAVHVRVGHLLLWGVVYALYAAADEWLQSFVGREMSLTDWFADVAGILTGTAIMILIRRRDVSSGG